MACKTKGGINKRHAIRVKKIKKIIKKGALDLKKTKKKGKK